MNDKIEKLKDQKRMVYKNTNFSIKLKMSHVILKDIRNASI